MAVLLLLTILIPLETCAQGATAAAAHAANGISLAKARQWPAAEEELRAAVLAAPQVAAYRAQLGSVQGLQSKWREALGSFEKAVELDPENLNFRREAAAVQWQLGLLGPAEANLGYVLQRSPGDPGATLLLGLVAEARGNFATASKLLASQFALVAAQPDRVVALFHSALESGDRVNLEKVIAALRMHASDPLWANAFGRCVQIAATAGDVAASESLFALTPAGHPQEAAMGLEIAKLRYRNGQFVKAQELLLHLAEHGPVSADAEILLGNCYEAGHRPQLAAQAYERAMEVDPTGVSPYEDMISLQLDLGKTGAALDFAERALAIAPNNAKVWVWKGNVELHRNAYKEAQDSFLQASKLDRANADALLGLGGAQALAGLQEAAIAEYQNGISRFPDDARFYLACAAMFLASPDAPQRQSQTASLLDEALKRTPHSAEAHYLLGQLALQRGRLQEAEREFLSSIALDAGTSKAHFALSVVYRRLGRTAEATEQFTIYQRLKPAEENEPAAATPAEKP